MLETNKRYGRESSERTLNETHVDVRSAIWSDIQLLRVESKMDFDAYSVVDVNWIAICILLEILMAKCEKSWIHFWLWQKCTYSPFDLSGAHITVTAYNVHDFRFDSTLNVFIKIWMRSAFENLEQMRIWFMTMWWKIRCHGKWSGTRHSSFASPPARCYWCAHPQMKLHTILVVRFVFIRIIIGRDFHHWQSEQFMETNEYVFVAPFELQMPATDCICAGVLA